MRYGIITPYTSFLIEEDIRVLSEEGRDEVARREYEIMATATPAPAFGAPAVDKAVAQEALRGAETAWAPTVAEVKHVGDKAFVLKDGIWIDTTYDPSRMETIKIGFGGETYFAFLAAHAEWGPYFALGDHIIVVLTGQAYEILEGDYPAVEVP